MPSSLTQMKSTSTVKKKNYDVKNCCFSNKKKPKKLMEEAKCIGKKKIKLIKPLL